MTQNELRVALTKAFSTHMFMGKRSKHTINELLYVLEHDEVFNGMNFSISIIGFNNDCVCIPCLDAFVNVGTRAMWFKDDEVELEVETYGEEQFYCITVYESEVN